MRLAVIADDFTGANDAGMQLRKNGLDVVTLFEDSAVECDVKIVSTESRNIDAEEARQKVEKTFKSIQKNGFDKFYKKIDSTMRGNINEEIKAISDNIDENEKIIFIAAFPEAGRTTINGIHYVFGEPVAETEFGKDPVKPVKNSNILDIVQNASLVDL